MIGSDLRSKSQYYYPVVLTVAQQTPNLLDGVQFPGSEPSNGIVSVMVAPEFVELVARDRYFYSTP